MRCGLGDLADFVNDAYLYKKTTHQQLKFVYIVYELLVGLAAVTASELDPVMASKTGTAQVMTVTS